LGERRVETNPQMNQASITRSIPRPSHMSVFRCVKRGMNSFQEGTAVSTNKKRGRAKRAMMPTNQQ